jgi:hypothetical protein
MLNHEWLDETTASTMRGSEGRRPPPCVARRNGGLHHAWLEGTALHHTSLAGQALAAPLLCDDDEASHFVLMLVAYGAVELGVAHAQQFLLRGGETCVRVGGQKGKKTKKYSERRVFPKIGEKVECRVNLDRGSILKRREYMF